jgi:hypothetical protein
MKILYLSAIAALIVTAAFHTGPVEGSRSSDEKPNRFVIHDGALAVSRPDPSASQRAATRSNFHA